MDGRVVSSNEGCTILLFIGSPPQLCIRAHGAFFLLVFLKNNSFFFGNFNLHVCFYMWVCAPESSIRQSPEASDHLVQSYRHYEPPDVGGGIQTQFTGKSNSGLNY